MSALNFWKIDSDGYDGHPVIEVALGRPIVLYLPGVKAFMRNESNPRTNLALHSLLEGGNVEPGNYALYIPTLSSDINDDANNLIEVRSGLQRHVREMGDFLMPEIPVDAQELNLFFSKLTVVGYSRGCEQASALVKVFREKLTESGRFDSTQIGAAIAHLGIVNIAKRRRDTLPDYIPAASYTIASYKDTLAFPSQITRDPDEWKGTENWKWQNHAFISHTLQNNHLVVIDNTGDAQLRAMELKKTHDDAVPFVSKLEKGKTTSDWDIVDKGKYESDGHHLYLYTNTDMRLIPEKSVQVFQSMATAPVTVDVIQAFLRGSVEATAEKPRDAVGIIHHVADTMLLPEAKQSLKTKFEISKQHYEAARKTTIQL